MENGNIIDRYLEGLLPRLAEEDGSNKEHRQNLHPY